MDRITDKLYSWASILDPATLTQARESARMDFITPHLALMPDAHLGAGATVGSVIPTLGAIMPAAVGVDIGCGMQAVLTGSTKADLDRVAGDGHPLSELHASIARSVPLSAGAANRTIRTTAEPRVAELEAMPGAVQAEQALSRWRSQLGSLGSGNHFIEVSLDEQDRVWLFLHSGSRGVGNKLAQKHIRVAQRICTDAGVQLPNRDLAYLTEGTAEFSDYLEALRWAQHFALLNRDEMMDRVIRCTSDYLGNSWAGVQQKVACHHNYTEQETHYGSTVWLSRKGAIDASVGRLGLIPGSMGAASYVVRGLGNVEAYHSAPHGAGRSHSRTSARKTFTRDDLDRRMDGIAWGQSDAFLDEHPDAYKPIDQVMSDAADLVEIVHTLRQVVNVKGN